MASKMTSNLKKRRNEKDKKIGKDDKQLDEEKHNRAMGLLHHLKQRQDQISVAVAMLGREEIQSSELLIEVDTLRADLMTVRGSIERLLRIFRTCKDELTDSQYCTKLRGSLEEKQLQINARITRCTKLMRNQESVENDLDATVQIINRKSFQCHGTDEVRYISGDDNDLGYDKADLTDQESMEQEMASNSWKLPFGDPIYSQPSWNVTETRYDYNGSALPDVDQVRIINLPQLHVEVNGEYFSPDSSFESSTSSELKFIDTTMLFVPNSGSLNLPPPLHASFDRCSNGSKSPESEMNTNEDQTTKPNLFVVKPEVLVSLISVDTESTPMNNNNYSLNRTDHRFDINDPIGQFDIWD